jgi:uncharacterized low-complexity protein
LTINEGRLLAWAAFVFTRRKGNSTMSQVEEKVVEVLALSRCQYGNCGEVVKVPASEVKAAKAAGLIDDNPAAVKAAKG